MGLNFEEKKNVVSEVHDYFLNSGSIVAADYSGLTVSQITDLRKKAREKGVVVKVLKNTLAKRAVKGTEHETMADSLQRAVSLDENLSNWSCDIYLRILNV